MKFMKTLSMITLLGCVALGASAEMTKGKAQSALETCGKKDAPACCGKYSKKSKADYSFNVAYSKFKESQKICEKRAKAAHDNGDEETAKSYNGQGYMYDQYHTNVCGTRDKNVKVCKAHYDDLFTDCKTAKIQFGDKEIVSDFCRI
jgi:hypothetical protein